MVLFAYYLYFSQAISECWMGNSRWYFLLITPDTQLFRHAEEDYDFLDWTNAAAGGSFPAYCARPQRHRPIAKKLSQLVSDVHLINSPLPEVNGAEQDRHCTWRCTMLVIAVLCGSLKQQGSRNLRLVHEDRQTAEENPAVGLCLASSSTLYELTQGLAENIAAVFAQAGIPCIEWVCELHEGISLMHGNPCEIFRCVVVV